MIVAGLVFVAVVVRGPASTDNDLRGPGTVTTPATTLPDGTKTSRISGEDDGIAWTLEARWFPDGGVRVEARSEAGSLGWENPPTDRVLADVLTGDDGPFRLVAGTTPLTASTARMTLADGTLVPIDVMGGGDEYGVRMFATTAPAGSVDGATVEAFAADGTLLGATPI